MTGRPATASPAVLPGPAHVVVCLGTMWRVGDGGQRSLPGRSILFPDDIALHVVTRQGQSGKVHLAK